MSHEIHTDEKDPIILCIWIVDNLGVETEFQFGDEFINGSSIFFKNLEDAFAFKLAWG